MSNLTNAESYTWQIIQENYEKIPQLSISELAELAHVSLSTVNRTVRKKVLKVMVNLDIQFVRKSFLKSMVFPKKSWGLLLKIKKNF